MSKNAYSYLQYTDDWLDMENESKTLENILMFKMNRWQRALERQMAEIVDKDSQEYKDLEAVQRDLESATNVTSYNDLNKPNGVKDIDELKDFLAYGLFCKKISEAESLIGIKPYIKCNNLRFYLIPQDRCVEVLVEFDKKIEEMQSQKTEEEQASNLELKLLIRKRNELKKCNESFALVATAGRRKKYDMEIGRIPGESSKSKNLAAVSQNITVDQDISVSEQEEEHEMNEDSSRPKKYVIKSFDNEDSIPRGQMDISEEILNVLMKSGIYSEGKCEMTKGTIAPTEIIKKSIKRAIKFYKENPESQYLGNLYKWAAYIHRSPEIILNGQDKSGNQIYVCDYGILAIGSNISPTIKHPRGVVRHENDSNHIYGVTTLRPDGTNSQHVVIATVDRDKIKDNSEFCTNVFFNEKYIELAENINSHYIGNFEKKSAKEYTINVNDLLATETVNALRLALEPYNRILLSHAFEDSKGNIDLERNASYWNTYCTGTWGILLEEKPILKGKDVYRDADLQELFTEIRKKQLGAVVKYHIAKTNTHDSASRKSKAPDGYDDGPQF